VIYTTLLKTFYRARFGEPPDLSSGAGCQGLVVVADGVGGLDLCGTGLRYVMGAMNVPYLVKVVPWGHGFGRWHADLTNAANHELRAQEIADTVAAFQREHPAASGAVFLVGKSGGTGLIVKALEHLPAEAVAVAVLLSPALSPAYDLTRALRAVRREMVAFWSPLDLIVLGAGTRLFGTIDRVKSVSAGMVGFRPRARGNGGEDAPDPDPYRKLRQVRWRPSMAATGYLGGHVGPDNPAFLRKYVVPLLQAGDPDQEVP
jgi:hypothetical protein